MERRLGRGHGGKTVLKVGQMPPKDVTGSSKGMESRALLGVPEEVEGQHACGGLLRLPQKLRGIYDPFCITELTNGQSL